jgi:hypothetical protein
MSSVNRSSELMAGWKKWWFPLLLIGAAIGERALWAAFRDDAGVRGGEAFAVARAIAAGRGVADAYQSGQGPTAHLLPVSPGIAGGIYWLFGTDSIVATIVLTAWGIACAVGSYLLLARAFRALGSPFGAVAGAVAFLCLAPTYITQESIDFRAWEGGLALLLGATFLNQLAKRLDTPLHWPDATELALLAALTFVINPAFGIGVYTAGTLFMWGRWPLPRLLVLGLLAAMILAALLAPWVIRNDRVLGTPVLLRSNAGLELALANRPDAVDGRDQAARYFAQLEAIHPHTSIAAYERMQRAGGEVAYANALGKQAKRFLADHPAAAMRLFARHVAQTFVPPAWAFDQLKGGWAGRIKAALASLAGLLGLVGLGRRAWRDGRRWLYPGAMILVPALLMAPFQPIARYCYLIYALSVFFAADMLWALWIGFRTKAPRLWSRAV